MNRMNLLEISELLYDESDISVIGVENNQFYLDYPPIDVEASQIYHNSRGYYMSSQSIIEFISKSIFGLEFEGLYNQNGELLYIQSIAIYIETN